MHLLIWLMIFYPTLQIDLYGAIFWRRMYTWKYFLMIKHSSNFHCSPKLLQPKIIVIHFRQRSSKCRVRTDALLTLAITWNALWRHAEAMSHQERHWHILDKLLHPVKDFWSFFLIVEKWFFMASIICSIRKRLQGRSNQTILYFRFIFKHLYVGSVPIY